jgi:hypothetical protein
MPLARRYTTTYPVIRILFSKPYSEASEPKYSRRNIGGRLFVSHVATRCGWHMTDPLADSIICLAEQTTLASLSQGDVLLGW